MLDEKPKPSGLKLSMITQPVNRPAARPSRGMTQSQKSPAPLDPADQRKLQNEWKSALRTARFKSDLVDFVVIVPIYLALLIGLPLLIARSDTDPESHGGAYAAIGMFFLMIPLGIPIAALSYSGLAYFFAGSTLGKAKHSLSILDMPGNAASRRRKLLRPLIKWGLFVFVFLGLLIAATLVWTGNLDDDGARNISTVVFSIALFGAIPAILVFIVADRILPVIRSDCRSLTDLLTRTKVVFEDQPAEAETRSNLSKV